MGVLVATQGRVLIQMACLTHGKIVSICDRCGIGHGFVVIEGYRIDVWGFMGRLLCEMGKRGGLRRLLLCGVVIGRLTGWGSKLR